MRLAKAQTLIEMLVAMSVIAVGLLAAVTLVYSNMNLVERDVDEVVAVNLAREGVEMAKAQRDSNWLSGSPFDAILANGTDYTATPVWDGVGGRFSFDFAAEDFTHESAKIIQSADTASRYLFANYNSDFTFAYTPTNFSRLLTFHPICNDYSVLDSGATCLAGYKIGIRVESRIQWIRKGLVKAFTIYEDLYDWR